MGSAYTNGAAGTFTLGNGSAGGAGLELSSAAGTRETGTLSGHIAPAASGSEGFGFDPVFVPDGEERTVAELGDGWKAEHSHRANAARDLLRPTG